MTREEAIRILDPATTIEALAEIEYYAGFSGQKAKVAACDEACEIAVAAMRELSRLKTDASDKRQATSDAPLTFDELQQMKGEPVWIVWPDGRIKSQWWLVGRDGWYMMDFHCRKDYGETWIAYRHKPEEVQNENQRD